MLLNQSNAIGLAKASCIICHGVGVRVIRKDTEVPCHCIFRAIFRACLNRFRHCTISADHVGSVSLEFCRGNEGRRSYSRKQEEYVADFCLVSRRALNDEAEYTLFKYHFLLGADWKMCCRRLKMDRGSFFHTVYRIEQSLGRVFCELEPYALYPLDEYFGGIVQRKPPRRSLSRLTAYRSFRPPMAA
jgi:hypothetical protein